MDSYKNITLNTSLLYKYNINYMKEKSLGLFHLSCKAIEKRVSHSATLRETPLNF